MYNLKKEEEGREKGRKREGGEREGGREEKGWEKREEGRSYNYESRGWLSKFPGLLSFPLFFFFSVDLFTMKIFYVIFVDAN